MLSTLESCQKNDWKRHLSQLCHAYNSTKHSSTGFSPYYLMFGRHPRLPVDALLGTPSQEPVAHSDYAQEIRDKLRKAYKTAEENLNKAKDRQKQNYDKKMHGSAPQVGDKVLVKRLHGTTQVGRQVGG